MVKYVYDSWGKVLSTTGTLATTLGKYQLFRYRGYVYDEETGWYYLQSRYYDPTTCRFISADVLLSTGQGVIGHNSFAYCLNNPAIMFDSTGRIPCDIGIAFIYSVKECYTEPFTDDQGNTKYKTTITYCRMTQISFDSLLIGKTSIVSYPITRTVTLEFGIKNGIVQVNNDQRNIEYLNEDCVAYAFANEILNTTKKIDKEYLSGRTVKGLREEMLVHYRVHVLFKDLPNATVTDMGGTDKGKTGYDRNAWVFEATSGIRMFLN